MTHFEYISVAVSLIYSLVLAKLLGGIPSALAPEKRYWVHSVWIYCLLCVTVRSWWQIWSFQDAIWSPASFIALLFIPSVMYLRAAILLSSQPDQISSWKTHYYDVRKPFFLLQLVGVTNLAVAPWIIVGVHIPASQIVGAVSFGFFALLAALFSNPRLHEVIAVLSLIGFTIGVFSYPEMQ